MLRRVSPLFQFPSQRAYVSAARALKISKKQQPKESLYIECKKRELNIPLDTPLSDAKFGSIPLASKGWMHRKSTSDYFTIHPTVDDNAYFDDLPTADSLQKSLQFPEILLENLKNQLDITKLTKIQQEALSVVSDANHTLIAAETGCGKTLAYLLPIVRQILERKYGSEERQMNRPLALILTPGRELALQIAAVATKLTKSTDLKVKSILGGNTKQLMMNPEFEDVDILVGSIGAVSKLATTGIYRMTHVRHVVLDEADTLLDDSFSDKLKWFLRKFPFHKNHIQDDDTVGTQLILASATIPTNSEELLKNIIDTSTMHEVTSQNLHRLMPHITHKFLRMSKSGRPAYLLQLVKTELSKNRPIVVFGNKSATSDYVSIFLNNSGVKCINLNGDMLMKIRLGRFEQFQRGEVDVLSTTDVGSRGLDTTRAKHIINFDFPLHAADYVHRCGRIGRVGGQKSCVVTNFVSSRREIYLVQRIEHAARTNSVLPNVNGNITNIIHKRILKEMNSYGINEPAF